MCHLEDGRGRMMTVPSDSGQCCSNTCSITIMMVLCSVLTMAMHGLQLCMQQLTPRRVHELHV